MKKNWLMTAVLCCFFANTSQANDCLEEKNLVALDAQYEKALQVGDARFLDGLLAADFYWVHNLASLKENKKQLIERLQKTDEQTKARRSYDISVRQLGSTAVLHGLSNVDKWNADGSSFRTSRYQFMRTYVKHNDECKLLAVQTMKVWSSETNNERSK